MSDLRKFINAVTLTEMDWIEKSPVAAKLAQHPNDFVHFSKINKLGINPKKGHNDPHGIYFYPASWLLSNSTDRLKTGQQFGLDWPYYFIANINWSAPGIVLSKMTWDELDQIAQRNGWMKYWEMVTQHGGKIGIPVGGDAKLQLSDIPKFQGRTDTNQYFLSLPDYMDMNKPGSCLWHFCDMLQKNGLMSWAQCLKGIAYIYDDNTATIHNMEPAQLLVLDPRIIKVIESGDNRQVTYRNEFDWDHWGFALKGIFAKLQAKYGGEIVWKHKRPALVFSVGDKTFRTELSEKWGFALYIHYEFGRAKGYTKIESKDLRDLSQQQLVEKIDAFVQNISKHTNDLMFEPFIPEEIARMFVEGKVFNEEDLDWTTEIENPDDRTDLNWAHLETRGDHRIEADGIPILVRVWVKVFNDRLKLNLYIYVNDQHLADGNPLDDFTYLPDAMDAVFNKLTLSFSTVRGMYVREPDDSYYREKFPTSDQWTQFCGWVAVNTGLWFSGKLQHHAFWKHCIDAYNNIDPEDKDTLIYYIKRVMRKI